MDDVKTGIWSVGGKSEEICSGNRKDTAVRLLKDYIQRNRLQPDVKLPSVRALSEHFSMSRDATWRGLQSMQEIGWVYSLSNGRYAIAKEVYSEILRSLRLRAVFTGSNYIQFSGFRRFLSKFGPLCEYHNLDLHVELMPLNSDFQESIWQNCDVLLIDSDSSEKILEQFDNFPVPVIGLDGNYSDRYYVNIVTDHTAGGSMVAEYFIKQGASEVCVPYFNNSEYNPRVKARLNGFLQTWCESGRSEADAPLVQIPWSHNNFQLSSNVKEYIESARVFQNYFVTDGRLATCFLDIFDWSSLSVPREACVIGYDGSLIGEATVPPLTTIEQDMHGMAELAIEYIKKLAEPSGETVKSIARLKPSFVYRSSS